MHKWQCLYIAYLQVDRKFSKISFKFSKNHQKWKNEHSSVCYTWPMISCCFSFLGECCGNREFVCADVVMDSLNRYIAIERFRALEHSGTLAHWHIDSMVFTWWSHISGWIGRRISILFFVTRSFFKLFVPWELAFQQNIFQECGVQICLLNSSEIEILMEGYIK